MSYPKRIHGHIEKRGNYWLAGARCDYKKDSTAGGKFEFSPDFVTDSTTGEIREFCTAQAAVVAANEFAALLCKKGGKPKLWPVEESGATYPGFP